MIASMITIIYQRIMGEIRDLVKNPIDGIRYVENDEDTVSEIHAVMDGPGKRICALSLDHEVIESQ